MQKFGIPLWFHPGIWSNWLVFSAEEEQPKFDNAKDLIDRLANTDDSAEQVENLAEKFLRVGWFSHFCFLENHFSKEVADNFDSVNSTVGVLLLLKSQF